MSPFKLVYGPQATTMLDAMLPHVEDDDLNGDVRVYFQLAEETRQLARVRTTDEQLVNGG